MKRIFMITVIAFTASLATADTNSITVSTAELEDILTVIVATNSPLINLAGNLKTNLQAKLPPCKSSIPHKIGNTVLQPFDNAKAGMRLWLSVESRLSNQMIIRADVNHFDPNRGDANMGAEWKQMEFRFTNGNWRLTKVLGGAIK